MQSRFQQLRHYLDNQELIFPALVGLGFLLRLALSPFGTYQGDFHTWIGWADHVGTVGPGEFYANDYWCDYLPGYIYVLWLLDTLHTLTSLPTSILFKLPANLADVGITFLIVWTLSQVTSFQRAQWAGLAYLFNPAALSNSTLWGQVDSFHALPLLISLLLAVRERYTLSGIAASVAFMIKPQSIVIFPILLLLASRPVLNLKLSWRDRLIRAAQGLAGFSVAGFLIGFLIAWPFMVHVISGQPIPLAFLGFLQFIQDRFNTAYHQYEYASLNAFSFWGMIAMWKSDQITFLGITYKNWGTLIFAFFYAIVSGGLILNELGKHDQWQQWVRGWSKRFRKRLNQGSDDSLDLDRSSDQTLNGSQSTWVEQPSDHSLTISSSESSSASTPLLDASDSGADQVSNPSNYRSFDQTVLTAGTLIFFALFLVVTRAHERHLLPTIVFFSLIAWQSRRYWVFYGVTSVIYAINMSYAFTRLRRIDLGILERIMDPLVIACASLLIVIFLHLLVDYVRRCLSITPQTRLAPSPGLDPGSFPAPDQPLLGVDE